MNKIEAKEWTIFHGDYIRTEDDLEKTHKWILKKQKIINRVILAIGALTVFVLFNILLFAVSG